MPAKIGPSEKYFVRVKRDFNALTSVPILTSSILGLILRLMREEAMAVIRPKVESSGLRTAGRG